MNQRIRRQIPVFLLFLGVLCQSLAQSPLPALTAPQAGDHEEATDPLGRSTPHGTVVGFLQKSQSGNFKEAAEYLQLSKSERATRGEQIARELHTLMDKALVGRLGRISDRRQGSIQIGVPQNHERIGVFRVNDRETDVDLVHVSIPEGGEIWLFSSKLLAAVPDLYGQIETDEIEADLPGFLVRNEVLSTPLWRVLAFILLIAISFGLACTIVRILRAAIRMWLRRRHRSDAERVSDALAAPATLILTVVLHQLGVFLLGIPLLIRVYYQRLTLLILVAAIAWFVFPLISLWGSRARRRTLAGSGEHSDTLVLLGQRILKVSVVVIAILVMLSTMGFDMTTAIAGLGIGSIAIAFAAQKTLENLLGGISILGDQVIRVGDLCRVEEDVGVVEDISLRSTRIRTLARTELSVPNGQLANMTVENLSRSDKSLFRTTLNLRHDTSSNQLQAIMAEMRTLLNRDSRVDPATARVHIMGLGENSIEVEINCHILTKKFTEFLAIREELLLAIMDSIAHAGVRFAQPTSMFYLAHASESNQEEGSTAENRAPGLRKKVS